jgi:hypothetical protein
LDLEFGGSGPTLVKNLIKTDISASFHLAPRNGSYLLVLDLFPENSGSSSHKNVHKKNTAASGGHTPNILFAPFTHNSREASKGHTQHKGARQMRLLPTSVKIRSFKIFQNIWADISKLDPFLFPTCGLVHNDPSIVQCCGEYSTRTRRGYPVKVYRLWDGCFMPPCHRIKCSQGSCGSDSPPPLGEEGLSVLSVCLWFVVRHRLLVAHLWNPWISWTNKK